MLQTSALAIETPDKAELYRQLELQLRGLFEGEHDAIANAANMSALLFMSLPDINWVGFYFLDKGGGELVVGPFQGKPACVRIAVGRGVCGTAAAKRQSVLVTDVHEFPGHIACDAASNSELVVPLLKEGVVTGVFDIDSPRLARFDADDQAGVERLVAAYVNSLAV